LEIAVAVQRQTYELLLWLKRRARTNRFLLTAEQLEAFDDGSACEEWVRCNLPNFPDHLRPRNDRVRSFAYVLSSFFRISFRVDEVRRQDEMETTLIAGTRGMKGRRHKRKVIQRKTADAENLRRWTLTSLAEECGLQLSAECFDLAKADAELWQQLTRYAYGVELVRRCHYASQGRGVHQLWLELDDAVRKNLTAETIWQVRERLLSWLKKQNLEPFTN
jgi:hypothetical protein